MALKVTKEIPARFRINARMDEEGVLDLTIHAAAVYGTPVDKGTGEHSCSVRFERTPPELRTKLKAVLEEIRVHTEQHCATDLLRAIIVSRETALRLGEIKEEEG